MKRVKSESFTMPHLPEYFTWRAVTLLRQHILEDTPVMQQIIFGILLLTTAEACRQDWPAVFVHREASKYSVAAIGGFSRLDPHICKMLWRTNLDVAAITYTQTILELCYDPGPLESEAYMCLTLLAAEGLPLMGAGFREDLQGSSKHALLMIIENVIGLLLPCSTF